MVFQDVDPPFVAELVGSGEYKLTADGDVPDLVALGASSSADLALLAPEDLAVCKHFVKTGKRLRWEEI